MTDPEIQDRLDGQTEESAPRAALTITIQSWATPIVGAVMLLIGLAAGFYAYPWVEDRLGSAPFAAEAPAAATAPLSAPQAAESVSADPTVSVESRAALMDFMLSQTRHFVGDANAPVTLIEFSDFQWPYCGIFATGAWRQINEEYVSTGKVRFGYAHFAFLGPESVTAAEASECAADQDKFWEYHDLLFESQSGENQGAFNNENLKKWAGELGLDQSDFDTCLDSGKYTELVNTQTSTFQGIGVRSTPSFILNGKPIVGAQPFETFKQAIEEELAAK